MAHQGVLACALTGEVNVKLKLKLILKRLRDWAHRVKRDVVALYLAARDPRVPWLAKTVAACVVAYALSPIDLIPDFIPVIGYLDDVILVPLGILLAIRLIPDELMRAFRAKAEAKSATRFKLREFGP